MRPSKKNNLYTTQVNRAFRALGVVNSGVISKHYKPPSNRREILLNFRPLVTHKIMFWSANYSASVVYTKSSIPFSVGGSDGYLPPLRWIIVNYSRLFAIRVFQTPFLGSFGTQYAAMVTELLSSYCEQVRNRNLLLAYSGWARGTIGCQNFGVS